MLSGVGDAHELNRLDIPTVANLPGVGKNLQDHLQVYIQYVSIFSEMANNSHKRCLSKWAKPWENKADGEER